MKLYIHGWKKALPNICWRNMPCYHHISKENGVIEEGWPKKRPELIRMPPRPAGLWKGEDKFLIHNINSHQLAYDDFYGYQLF